MTGIKQCSTCGEVKSLQDFHKNCKTKDGLTSQCKLCRKAARDLISNSPRVVERRKAHYEANKEATLLKQKEDRLLNKDKYKEREAKKYLKSRDKILARVSEYQKENPEVNRKAGKKYREATPHKQCAKAAKRRARLLRATPEWTLDDEWEQFYLAEIYHLSALRTGVLGELYNVDHMVPLTSKLVCGLHVSSNLQVLLGAKNSSKMNRYWPDMW